MSQTTSVDRPRVLPRSCPPDPTALRSSVRGRVLRILADLPPAPTPSEPFCRSGGMTASDLAARMELHVSTVRDHLTTLEDEGLVRHHDVRGHVGRPRRHYVVDPLGLAGVVAPDAYQLLAEPLTQVLTSHEPDAVAAGRAWAANHTDEFTGGGAAPVPATTRSAFLAKAGALLDTLERWGHVPEAATADSGHTVELHLTRCPLRELAADRPDAACGVHEGVLAGALAALGEPDANLQLLPLVRPGLCVVRITTRARFPRPGESRSGHDRKASHD